MKIFIVSGTCVAPAASFRNASSEKFSLRRRHCPGRLTHPHNSGAMIISILPTLDVCRRASRPRSAKLVVAPRWHQTRLWSVVERACAGRLARILRVVPVLSKLAAMTVDLTRCSVQRARHSSSSSRSGATLCAHLAVWSSAARCVHVQSLYHVRCVRVSTKL